MRSEIQAFEIRQNYSEKVFCQHLLRGKRDKKKEGNVKREKKGRQWEGSGYNQDELDAESGSVDRGLLLSREQAQPRQDEAGRCGDLAVSPGQQASESYAGKCHLVLKTCDGDLRKGNILGEVSLDND